MLGQVCFGSSIFFWGGGHQNLFLHVNNMHTLELMHGRIVDNSSKPPVINIQYNPFCK